MITKKTVKVLGAYWNMEMTERIVTFTHYTPLGSKTGTPFKVEFRRRPESDVLACSVRSDMPIRFGVLTQLNKIARKELEIKRISGLKRRRKK